MTRKFLGVIFECCRVYARLYMNREGTAYCGRCPKCGRPLSIPVEPENPSATESRFFRAS